MCQTQSAPWRMGHAFGCTCGCCGCGCGTWARHFIAPVEEREMLERYRNSLQKELAGLNERLKELEACSK